MTTNTKSTFDNSKYILDDIPTFNEPRRIIYCYNPDTKKDVELADGTNLMSGGFGADVTSGCWQFGEVKDVPHGARTSAEYVSKCLSNIAVLGWESYWLARNAPRGDKNSDAPKFRLKKFHRVNDPAWSSSSRMVYYIAFLDDPELNVHAVQISGTSTMKGNENISGIMPALAVRAANLLGVPMFSQCGIRTKMCVAKSIKVTAANGNSNDTGSITPPRVDVESVKDDELMKRIVDSELYARLVQRAREVKAEIDENEATAHSFGDLLKLNAAPTMPESPEPDYDMGA